MPLKMRGANQVIFEVIAHNLTDVKHAEAYGADRIELVKSMGESGITPSYGLIKTAVESVSIPVNVIVRPHGRTFVYSEDDVQEMLHDIDIVKEIGANGIVIGAITKDGVVDEKTIERLLERANGLEIVFHRAIDAARDQLEALETILQYKEITTVLTSGGTDKATDLNSSIKDMIARTKDTHLTIMPGSGIYLDTLQGFVADVHPDAIHIGSGIRYDHSFDKEFDKEKMQAVINIIK